MANNVVTKLEELNLMDKFLFDETMEDTEAYQATVSILLENEIELLDKPETEKELRVSPQLRQVRLDVVSMDRDGKLYYAEMQQKNTGNLRKRSRYYQAQLDVSLLEPSSTDFNLLNDSCFILIAPFDLFGKGLYRYTFEGVCRECPDLKLEDGATRIFINTKGTNRQEFSQEFLDFMEYITSTTDAAAEETQSGKIKISKKMGVKFMQKWEELAYARDEGHAEGYAAGHSEGLSEGYSTGHSEGLSEGYSTGHSEGLSEGENLSIIKMVCKKLQKGKTPEEISEDLEADLNEILRIYNAAKEYSPNYDAEKIYHKLFE
ncbi:MAG: Rpn family recombination-promoting nuclease/putative transposase [Firmicutes bacterium]|nr:Rpn family recombination-promoting nuclease/putative transposase [Bacillota bacterium]